MRCRCLKPKRKWAITKYLGHGHANVECATCGVTWNTNARYVDSLPYAPSFKTAFTLGELEGVPTTVEESENE